MKVLVQIPCKDEALTLAQVIYEIPRSIEGVDEVHIQVIDDGSSDNTSEIARTCNADHVITLGKNIGLAGAFMVGVENAINFKYDYLINTDGDNQYSGSDIKKLIACAISTKSDLVIGVRDIWNHNEFSYIKKVLQYLGSYFVRKISNTNIPDATSGFRAYSRNALLKLNVHTKFSYCLESLLQISLMNMKISSVPISVNSKTRESRLFRNIPEYIYKQIVTIIHVIFLYRSSLIFNFFAILFFIMSGILIARYFIIRTDFDMTAYWPSLAFASAFFVLSVLMLIGGIISTQIQGQRKLIEDLLSKFRDGKN
jgi:glycosyltransferase involved in cell wall biosynthesis